MTWRDHTRVIRFHIRMQARPCEDAKASLKKFLESKAGQWSTENADASQTIASKCLATNSITTSRGEGCGETHCAWCQEIREQSGPQTLFRFARVCCRWRLCNV